jgi:hypothetical protein
MQARFQMNRATPQMRHFAKRLMDYDTSGSESSETKTPAVFHTCEKLRPHLTTLMGNGGFRALLSRALALANAEVPWLRPVQLMEDGSLEGVEDLQAQLDPDEFFEGGLVLLAQLLGLLVTFIGEDLTSRLVREGWPKIPLNDLDFSNGGEK